MIGHLDLHAAPPSLPASMTWAQMEARARAEGVWDDLLKVGVFAGMVGVERALQDVKLPTWAQAVARSQLS